MKTTVSSKGQIVLPAELRQRDQIAAGQEFEIERIDRGEYRLVRRGSNEGVCDWQSCWQSSAPRDKPCLSRTASSQPRLLFTVWSSPLGTVMISRSLASELSIPSFSHLPPALVHWQRRLL